MRTMKFIEITLEILYLNVRFPFYNVGLLCVRAVCILQHIYIAMMNAVTYFRLQLAIDRVICMSIYTIYYIARLQLSI